METKSEIQKRRTEMKIVIAGQERRNSKGRNYGSHLGIHKLMKRLQCYRILITVCYI
jgi:hypothetical protein